MRAEIETLADRAGLRPRDPEACLAKALKELELSQKLNPGRLVGDRYEDSHAEGQYYVISYGDDEKPITGLSIGAAWVLSRQWSNMLSKVRLTGETADAFDCGSLAIDLENLYAVERFRRESKWYRSRKTKKLVKHREDRYPQILGKAASIAQRNAILAVVPEPIQTVYWNRCKELVASTVTPKKGKGAASAPHLKDLVPKMLAWLLEYGVTREHVEKKLGHSTDTMTPEEFADLKGRCAAMKAGETDAYAAFGAGSPPEEGEEVFETDPMEGSKEE